MSNVAKRWSGRVRSVCRPVVVGTCILASCTRTDASSELDDPAAIIAGLEATIPAVVARGNSPSIQVAVVHEGEVIWSRAYGDNTSVRHVYLNASVQKVYDAVAVLRLLDRGLVELDADVSSYLPFVVRHPRFPDAPITLRLLLGHRSGLGTAAHQFDWDTGNTFAPRYRRGCDASLAEMTPEEFLTASLSPEGANFTEDLWEGEPGAKYLYSNTAFPLLQFVVARVAKQTYPEYLQQHVFGPLGMERSGFRAEAFDGRQALPHTRSGTENVELPLWGGNGNMMFTTAEDQARFMIALMDDDATKENPLLRPETVELMKKRTSRFGGLFRKERDQKRIGHGLGLHPFQRGWYGYGGSSPGYQCLWRFHPAKGVGYVIHANVNAVLTGGDNYESAREEVYTVQDAILSILDP